MAGPAELIGLLAAISQLAGQILALAGAAKRNKEKCKQLSERVLMINKLMEALQSQWTPNPVTESILQNLRAVLIDGEALLVMSCQKKRTWSHVFKTQREADKFDALDNQISKTLEQFHLANMILIVNINKDRFFMNVLEKLLKDGACKRLPQVTSSI